MENDENKNEINNKINQYKKTQVYLLQQHRISQLKNKKKHYLLI